MNRLRDLREDHDLTQTELAECIGSTKANISRYESGAHWMSQDIIDRICDYFGVTSDYLLCRSRQPHPVVSEPDTALLAAYHAAPAEIRLIVDTALAPYAEDNKKDASAAS